MKRSSILIVFLGLVVGGLAWWGGTALATHDDPDIVHLCVHANGNVKKVVEDPADCGRRATALDLAAASAITELEAELAALEARVVVLETLLDGVSLDFDYSPGETTWRFEGGLFATGHATTGGTGNFGDLLAMNAYFGGDVDVDGGLDVVGTVTGGKAGWFTPGTDATVLVDGNLQVVNGTGTTSGTTNGQGNVIIGYDVDVGDTKTGSHNLVVGDEHSYSSFSGIVSGYDNSISGALAFASGSTNDASGVASFVGGGYDNAASGVRSAVVGGSVNTADGVDSLVAGGQGNEALDSRSFAGGGFNNTASGGNAFVGGGSGSTAGGADAFVGGGGNNVASGNDAFVGGGGGSVASGLSAFVGGGQLNVASGHYSFIGGGVDHEASGDFTFVGGGQADVAGPGTCGYVADTLIGTC